MFAYSV